MEGQTSPPSKPIVTDGVPHGAAFDGAAFDVPSEKASWEQRVKLLKHLEHLECSR